MIQSNYDVMTRNGKEKFVMVPLREFNALLEKLEDEADFRILEASKKRHAGKSLIPHAQVMRELGLAPRPKKRKT